MSRSDARSRGLRRRPSRVVPASIVAAVLTAIGVLAVISALLRLINGSWPGAVTSSASAIAGLTWGSAAMIAAGAVIAVLGLILVICAWTPGGYRSATLQTPAGGQIPDVEYVMSTRAMARLAAARADLIDGVDRVSASASAGRVHLDISSSSAQTGAVRDRVQGEVHRVLSAAGLQPVPRVTANVRSKGL